MRRSEEYAIGSNLCWVGWSAQSTKSQITNNKQITMTEIPTVFKAQAANRKPVAFRTNST